MNGFKNFTIEVLTMNLEKLGRMVTLQFTKGMYMEVKAGEDITTELILTKFPTRSSEKTPISNLNINTNDLDNDVLIVFKM